MGNFMSEKLRFSRLNSRLTSLAAYNRQNIFKISDLQFGKSNFTELHIRMISVNDYRAVQELPLQEFTRNLLVCVTIRHDFDEIIVEAQYRGKC